MLIAPLTPRETARRRLLDVLRWEGPMARVEIGQQLGMSPATVSDLTASLLDDGVLVTEEAGDATPGLIRGRPKVRLFFAETLGSVIGVWTGFNRIELRLVDSAGRNRASRHIERPLRTLGAEELMDVLAQSITAFARETGAPDVKAVGLACQGYVDTKDGIVAWSPVLGARDLPLASGLSERLGLPVLIENDASAMAFAIAQRDPALRTGRTACLMVGDGVGMGFLINGELYRGARFGGSEFGHVRLRRGGPQCRCGGRGCIEAFLADYALHRDAQLIDHRPAPTALIPGEDAMDSIVAQARAGDPALQNLFREAGEVLGDAVGILIQTLEPDHIVICGPGTRAIDLLRPSFEAALESQTIPELRALTTIHVVESSMDLLTEGVVMQALRELDLDLARLKAA
ncbi:ROK family transcriptional regulator [Microvirga terricola]|uniref:ROK family transcriptional regulator n=1 Tax=Microvirga terricola TaxID=2719797 RepID=A0ABX0V9A5_9HYPH|nr:ROK family transcriptional regulator [Microvirga terricola]NIX75784.1 ROK family transcriptional regulator [Microvirga terricola]